MTDILLKFCGDRIGITEPYSIGSYSFATDGSILIRVNRLPGITEKEKAPKIDGVFEKADEHSSGLSFDIPEVNPKTKECPACQGVGANCECPECDGKGLVTLSNDFNDYDCDCDTCDATGKVAKCEDCNGTGRVYVRVRVRISKSDFADKYLALLKELPDCKLYPSNKPEGIAKFKFNGGDGLLMPMRSEP